MKYVCPMQMETKRSGGHHDIKHNTIVLSCRVVNMTKDTF